MALVVKDRVMETTSTTGTGTLTLAGAVSGFQSFAAIGDGNTTYYTIYSGTDWEVGIGTYTSSGTTLSRDTVLESSAGGTTKISVASGAQVFVTYPAERSVDTDTAQTLTNKTFDGGTVVTASSSVDALRITQTGSGNALVVEDAANPDATPTVIDQNGRVIVGGATPYNADTVTPKIQVVTDSVFDGGFGGSSWSSDANGQITWFAKSKSGTIGSHSAVTTNDVLMDIRNYGSDGSAFAQAARIATAVDGTVASNSVPSRITFSTTAVGGTSVTERMRISSAGVITTTGTQIINANTSTDALRITQTGAGNALLVEDSANPDATPFVVDTSGRVIAGHTATIAYGAFTPIVQSQAASQNAGFAAGNWQNTAGAPNIWLGKSRGGIGTHTVVQSGDGLGNIRFYGSDGTGFIESASIYTFVDGTPGTNDMPGRLVFSTTADAASSPTERFRISSFGGWGLAGANYGTSATQAIVSNGNAAAPTWQDIVTPTASQTLTNKTLTSPTITGAILNDGYTEEVYAVVDAAGVALSPTNGSIQTWTLGASRTPTAGTWAAGQSMTMMIDDGTAYTVTWTSLPVTWVGGVAPTLATTGFTVIQLWKVGTTIYGARVGEVA